MERYCLPLKFTEEERSYYADWGIKKEKMIMVTVIPIAIALIASILLSIGIMLKIYTVDYWLFKYTLWGIMASGSNWLAALQSIIFLIFSFAIVRIEDFVFDLIHKKPAFEKHADVTMDISAREIILEIICGKKLLASQTISFSQVRACFDEEQNTVMVDGTEYAIGANTRKTIYLKKAKPWHEQPARKKSQIESAMKIIEIVDGIKMSLEAKQKEEEWERRMSCSAKQSERYKG